ncbi:MAG: MmgE/PrpD family protein [Acetobacteraceae bacterium]|nr:MmgE/PrpD family protein [Acetobacteraceae bacterium]
MERERTTAEEIAEFVLRVSEADFADGALDRLKRSVLDTLGCAIGALASDPVHRIRAVADELGGPGKCMVIGGGLAAPDRAAFVNGCLVRYLDFMNNYVAKGEVCHPNDNFAAMLAAAQYAGRSGRELLIGLAVAYQAQCRLIESLPTMRAGLNYTPRLAFSVAAGAARLLGFDENRTAHALALAGVSSISLG